VNPSWSSDASEARRLAILACYPVDEDEISGQLDRLAGLAAKLCDAPIGLVCLVEADRQRFIGRSGFDATETPREGAFCDFARLADDGLVVPDASKDPRFRDNPLVTGSPGIRLYASQPLRSLEGAPLGTLCVIDTHARIDLSKEQFQGLRTLADAVMGMLERWRLDSICRVQAARSKSAIHDLQQRFEVLADAMPQMVWSTLPNGHVDYLNQRWCEYTGAPAAASHGDGWMRFLHPKDRPAVERVWKDAVASGGGYEIEYRLLRADGEHRWMLARGLPMRDEAGQVYRWIGTCTDIQEQKAIAEQHELLTRELSHRIKNIFAVIGGLVTLSARRHPELAELGNELHQRVLALGRAHDFVRPHSEFSRVHHSHTSLHGMLGSLLRAYQTQPGERVRICGDDVPIDDRSATPLALFFHELATNAAKYGALSNEAGHVEIAIDAAGEDVIRLAWTERDGPPVKPTTERGFGATLIEMSIKRQLGGMLDYDWRDEGLRVHAQIPVQMMAR
jgi:PAS domain S-box-containing protein